MNIRDVGPVTGETMNEGSIGCMGLSGGNFRHAYDFFNPFANFARDIFFSVRVGTKCSA